MNKIILMAILVLGLLSTAKAEGMTRVKSFHQTSIDKITSAIEALAWENKILDVSLDSCVLGNYVVRFNAIVLYEAK